MVSGWVRLRRAGNEGARADIKKREQRRLGPAPAAAEEGEGGGGASSGAGCGWPMGPYAHQRGPLQDGCGGGPREMGTRAGIEKRGKEVGLGMAPAATGCSSAWLK